MPESLLSELHRIWTGEARDLEDLWDECLAAGLRALGCRTAYLTEVFDDEVVVRAARTSAPALPVGACLALEDLPDREAARIRTTVVADGPDQLAQLRSTAVAEALGWSTHLVTPVTVHQRLYGTLGFADPDLRLEAYSSDALAFLELLAARIGAAIEQDVAMRDSLTGLPNERILYDRLDQAIARRARQPGVLAVLFVDLDRFKRINDDLGGHDAGDAVLVAMADRMVRAVRPGDTVARVHGDEFLILCEAVPDTAAAEALAERVREAVRRPLAVLAEPIVVTCSIGVALVASDPTTADDVIDRADTAMYRAKSAGRDRVEIVVIP
jgi:diguanylate cyclase (GGDEF)-like protein